MRSAADTIADVRARLEGIRGVNVPEERMFKCQRRAMLAISILPLLGLVFAVVQLWGWGVSLHDLVIAGVFYVVSGLGITVGFHRLLTHKSFDVPNWVRVGWAIAGSLAIQGACIDWVATHRRHHAYSDELGDPHSPHLEAADGVKGILRGLCHAHLGWMFVPDGTDAETWAPDLLDNEGVANVNRMFPWLIVASFVLPAIIGGLWSWSLMGALTAFVWAGPAAHLPAAPRHVVDQLDLPLLRHAPVPAATTPATTPGCPCCPSASRGTTPTTPSRPRRATVCAGGSSTPPGSRSG